VSAPRAHRRLRSLWRWTRSHVLIFVNALLVLVLLVGLTLLGSGLFFSPSAKHATPPRTVIHHHSPPVAPTPAESALATLLTTQLPGYTFEDAGPGEVRSTVCGNTGTATAASTSTTLPTGAPIDPPATLDHSATLASSTLDVAETVRIFGAGLGGEVLADDQAAANCSTSSVSALTTLDGYQATSTSYSAPSVQTVEFRVGDVVVTLSVFPMGYAYDEPTLLALATSLDTRLHAILSPVCVDMNAPASAANRNPTVAAYAPFATKITLRPPSSIVPPDPSLVNGQLPKVTVPAGSVTSPPVAPTVPTVALTTSVAVPVADSTGPGCGWAFTAMVVPPFTNPSSSLSVLEQTALQKLEDSWTRWPTVAAQYRYRLAMYNARLAAYTASTTTTAPPATTTTTRPVATTTSTSVPTTTTTAPAPNT